MWGSSQNNWENYIINEETNILNRTQNLFNKSVLTGLEADQLVNREIKHDVTSNGKRQK